MKKYVLTICSVLLLSVMFMGGSASAGQITEVVTAKSSWQNTGNIVKEKTTSYGKCKNYTNYGKLNKTKIRVRAKIGGDYVTVLSAVSLPKDNVLYSMSYSNTVNAGKLIRFCYTLPDSSVSSDKCKITYNLY